MEVRELTTYTILGGYFQREGIRGIRVEGIDDLRLAILLGTPVSLYVGRARQLSLFIREKEHLAIRDYYRATKDQKHLIGGKLSVELGNPLLPKLKAKPAFKVG